MIQKYLIVLLMAQISWASDSVFDLINEKKAEVLWEALITKDPAFFNQIDSINGGTVLHRLIRYGNFEGFALIVSVPGIDLNTLDATNRNIFGLIISSINAGSKFEILGKYLFSEKISNLLNIKKDQDIDRFNQFSLDSEFDIIDCNSKDVTEEYISLGSSLEEKEIVEFFEMNAELTARLKAFYGEVSLIQGVVGSVGEQKMELINTTFLREDSEAIINAFKFYVDSAYGLDLLNELNKAALKSSKKYPDMVLMVLTKIGNILAKQKLDSIVVNRFFHGLNYVSRQNFIDEKISDNFVISQVFLRVINPIIMQSKLKDKKIVAKIIQKLLGDGEIPLSYDLEPIKEFFKDTNRKGSKARAKLEEISNLVCEF